MTNYNAKNPRGRANVLTVEQIDNIVRFAQPPFNTVFAICAYTGCRISEALWLTTDNIQNGSIVFTRTKNDEARTVPINGKLATALIEGELPATGHLFPPKRQDAKLPHRSRQDAHRKLKEVATELGIVCTTHSFRRSCLTRLKDHGHDLKTIASISGHKDLNKLSGYLEVTETQKATALECL